ncbi:MAG: SGNH/GDSL hydrolase family protein [Chloroflexi bacterium]|nr:MAG: SGNH/GDSL hydrolase family protein [Chloroflexota bacterium]
MGTDSTQWWNRVLDAVRTLWITIGLAFLLFLPIEGTYRVAKAVWRSVIATPHLNSPNATAAWYPQYEREFAASAVMRWEPYVQWRRAPFQGRYINVDSLGLRRTVQSRAARDGCHSVFLFGGSTMWGTGQRDAQTIPSLLSRQLEARGLADARLINFGETGYVFTQEVVTLILELRSGARPQVVVFYDGLNDVTSAAINGRPGLPQNEEHRIADFALGRELASGRDARTLLTLARLGLERSRLLTDGARALRRSAARSVSGSGDSLGRGIAAAYAATAGVVEALSVRYGFRALYAWQPTLFNATKPLSDFERALRDSLEGTALGRDLFATYAQADTLVNILMSRVASGRFFNLAGVFSQDTSTLFIDSSGHTTEAANPAIVAQLVAPVTDALRAAPRCGSTAPNPPTAQRH